MSLSSLENAWGYYKYTTDETKEISGRVEINEERLLSIRNEIKAMPEAKNAVERAEAGHTSQLLEVVLGGALALSASDIHLEAMASSGILRFRIDGLLHTVYDVLPLQIYRSLLTRIKLLSSLKLNITSEAQDGRFTIDLKEQDIEIRTSVIPSEYGETIVMRVLDPSSLKIDLEELGWREDDLKILNEEIVKPNGLILNTGPTGSGKTTTLYAILRRVFRPEIKIITIEDPIEYHLSGISQTQVDTEAKYTFASGLRSILRQDPNIVLVGEIRDKETAGIAINASLTGHLVFSTLHTNDAVGAIPRLFDLDVKPQVMGPALTLVVAQRLVRTLCKACKKPLPTDSETQKKLSSFLQSLPARVSRDPYSNPNLFESVGCSACNNFGYKGRISIFELFRVDETIENLIYQNPTETQLRLAAKEKGFVTMQEDGILKVLSGITTFSEVERLTGSISFLQKTS
ncbi:hypothetical protein A3A21_02460 [Candidatus Jorgensenbacteria bacterium RIFCSPLOWO2_01_FULL_45_25b]|uniref:Bacterial type II secretion system protein E domain-containing protein n=1 Tax=Candidatus Jorgensenbacteria bacterium RIFCSPLOWO2_01_FULL_45_25b TaxID=1798471 RepID=A0A1F6BTX5_9BACT|nr:MAG: hypothetical protein A3A21_02460 [Candidatus Jorgensenbacteria bacterium RIFCSPLOWO2_01_FULL_45_25b]